MNAAWAEARRRYWEELGPRDEYVRKIKRKWNRERRAEMSVLQRLTDPLFALVRPDLYDSDFIAYLSSSYPPMKVPQEAFLDPSLADDLAAIKLIPFPRNTAAC
jgi:hypothetical protein